LETPHGPSFGHENHTNHPLHHIAFIHVALIVLLSLEVIFFMIEFVIIAPSFLAHVMSYDPYVVWMEYVWLPFLEL
jgi:hypothetical protein